MIRLAFAAALALCLSTPARAQSRQEAQWEHLPTSADFARVYPPLAKSQHINGRVLLNCLVLRSHRLRCTVTREDPPRLGFGRAALQLSREFRIATRTREGRSTVGGHIPVPLSFTAQLRVH